MEEEARSGVRTLAALFLVPLLGTALFSSRLGLEQSYFYGFLALAALAVHIHFSSRAVHDIGALYLLGMVLLVVSGTTFVLIAHSTQALGPVIFASVGLLFMAIPTVPWGLREGGDLRGDDLRTLHGFHPGAWPTVFRRRRSGRSSSTWSLRPS